jgi:hypothetical protein
MLRRLASVTLLGAIAVLLIALLAAPALAEITKGSCQGSAEFPDKQSDKVLDAARPRDDAFAAPPGATVGYAGDLGPGATESDQPVAFQGGVTLRIPRMSVTIVSWEGETTAVSDSGGYTYDLPDIVPRGTGPLQLTAWHDHTGYPDCEAIVSVTIDGSPGVAAYAAGGLTLLAGAGTVAAGRKKA